MKIKKENECQEMIMEIKSTFNAVLSFNKLSNTEILSQ